MSLDLTTVAGTIYDANGAPKSGVRVTIKRVVKDGAVISSVDRTSAPSDANGLISFTVPRNSTAWLKADIEGFTSSPNTGVPVSIPDAPTANLEDLIPAISAPSTAVSQAALNAETAARIAGDAALADDIANIDLSGYATTSALTTGLAAKLSIASNLSDLGNTATARTNLGLGSLATLSSITASQVSDFNTAADARISAWAGAAPAQLDTLNELATALNNDANFASTMTTALAGKMANTSGAIVSALGYTPYGSVSALTANRLARVTGAGVIGNSLLSDDGTDVSLTGTGAMRLGVSTRLRLMNLDTDTANYERGVFQFSSNVLQLGTEKGGTGTARNLTLITDSSTRITLFSTGGARFHTGIDFATDNTLDVGALTANRARTLHLGTSVTVAGTKVIGAQGAAVADATDAASAITQLNALLARLRAATGHGLIA